MKPKFDYLWFLILLPLVLSLAGFSSLAVGVNSAAPGNDNFFKAAKIHGFGGIKKGSNKGATKENFEVKIAGNKGGASIWYVWEAKDWKMLEFNTVGSDFDTLLGVYTWPDPSKPLKTIVTNDDSPEYSGHVSQISFPSAKNKMYYIVVDGYNSGAKAACGNVILNWISSDIISSISKPPNVVDQMEHPPVYTFSCAFTQIEPGEETIDGGSREKPAQLELCLARFKDGPVDVMLTGPNNQEIPLPSFHFNTAQSGRSWKYVMPLDYPVGRYRVKLSQGDTSITYNFQLVEAAEPNVVADPSIRVGHSFNVYLAGFRPNTRISLNMYRKNPSICSQSKTCYKYFASYKAQTDSKGQGTYRLMIKSEYGGNDYVILVVLSDTEKFEVTFTTSQ